MQQKQQLLLRYLLRYFRMALQFVFLHVSFLADWADAYAGESLSGKGYENAFRSTNIHMVYHGCGFFHAQLDSPLKRKI